MFLKHFGKRGLGVWSMRLLHFGHSTGEATRFFHVYSQKGQFMANEPLHPCPPNSYENEFLGSPSGGS
jgi:hypothetical protein